MLFPAEAEAFVQELRPMGVADVGSEKWVKTEMHVIPAVTHKNNHYNGLVT